MQKANKNKNYQKNLPTRFIFIIAIIIGLSYTYFTSKPNENIEEIQNGISNKIIRFHVIANSDSSEDQELKLKVKEAVVNYTKNILADSKSIDESRIILKEETNNILALCNQIITENGYDYNVSAELSDTYFPTKTYGQYTFPPGNYEAYQIKIGTAKGQNWWCVLYPPLCFVDISHGFVEGESERQLEETLTTEEFNAISGDCNVKFRFKYLTFFNKLFD